MSTRPFLVNSGSGVSSASANNVVIPKPSGIQVGDYLTVETTNSNQPPSDWTLPSGWSRIGTPFVVNDADQRGTGLFGFSVTDAAVLAALPASWTFAFPGTARILGSYIRIWRAVDLTAPIGGNPAHSTGATAARVMPSFTVARNNSLLVFAATNQVTSPNAATATVTDGTVTNVGDYATPGDTTVTRTALKTYTKAVEAGASGTQTVTWTGAATGAAIMGYVLNPIPDPSVDYAASWWDGTTEHVGALTWTDGAGGEIAIPSVDAQPRVQSVTTMLALPRPINWAHRGGSANWPEFSLRAYRESAKYWQVDAVEVSVWKSTDGTFWCNHDDSLSYTTNGAVTTNISAMNDAALAAVMVSPIHTDNTGQPSEHLATLQQVSDFLPGVVIVIEDKSYANQVALMTFINANGGAARFIWKQSGPGTRYPGSSTLKAWGYFFDSDMVNFAAKQAQWDYVGLDYLSTDATLIPAIATAGATRVINHIIPNLTQANRMLGLGVRGLMIANVRDIVTRFLP